MSEQPMIAGAISGASLPCASQHALSRCPGAVQEPSQPREQPHAGSVPSITPFWTLRARSSSHWLSVMVGPSAGQRFWMHVSIDRADEHLLSLTPCVYLSGHASLSQHCFWKRRNTPKENTLLLRVLSVSRVSLFTCRCD